MLIKHKCDRCGGTGGEVREIQVGDVVTPQDGSSMCGALHRLLHNTIDQTEGAFKPVKVVAIEGDMLGVVPAYWSDNSKKNQDLFGSENHVFEACCYIWKGEKYLHIKSIEQNGFWIHAYVSHFKEIEP